jgi:uncharacterized membrane protein YqaE (UPF0057 family)
MVLNIVLSPLNPLIEIVILLAEAFIKIFEFLFQLLKMIPKLLTIFFYILDPVGLLNDLIFGFTEGVTMVFEALIDVLFRDLRNTMGKKDAGSNEGQGHKKVCVKPTYIETLILVLCPPLFIVLRQGFIAGFFPTIICFVLTYLFYLPGLIYAGLYYIC